MYSNVKECLTACNHIDNVSQLKRLTYEKLIFNIFNEFNEYCNRLMKLGTCWTRQNIMYSRSHDRNQWFHSSECCSIYFCQLSGICCNTTRKLPRFTAVFMWVVFYSMNKWTMISELKINIAGDTVYGLAWPYSGILSVSDMTGRDSIMQQIQL